MFKKSLLAEGVVCHGNKNPVCCGKKEAWLKRNEPCKIVVGNIGKKDGPLL